MFLGSRSIGVELCQGHVACESEEEEEGGERSKEEGGEERISLPGGRIHQ